MTKLLIVVNVDWFFLSHRLPVALAAQNAGYEVTIVTGNSGRIQEIAESGLPYIEAPVSRAGTNILKELKVLWFLIRLYRKQKPDIVHHVTPKMVAYGSVAARLTNTRAVNAVSGLGGIFSQEKKGSILFRNIILMLFKIGLSDRTQQVIFQNKDDKNILIENNIIKEYQAKLIFGSGVDLKDFKYSIKEKEENIIISLPARMLFDKGVKEFVYIAQSLRKQYYDLKFWLVGGTDTESINGVPLFQLEDWHKEGYVEWLGYQKDMVEIFKKTDIVLFPSFYGEGLPKSLIEACAVGRPIVCFDVVGCREVVKEGINGFLVPFKDVEGLANAVKKLIDNPVLRLEMGKNAREIAEKRFAIEQVIEKTLAIYDELLILNTNP